MKKNYLILTDALTYNGIEGHIDQADVGIFRTSDKGRIKSFLFDHWDEVREIHLYHKETILGLNQLISKDLNLENTNPNWVRATYGQVKVILKVDSYNDEAKFQENWESGKCGLELTIVTINKPKIVCDDPDEFLEGNSDEL